jgi:hypothetical protein
MYIPQHFTFGHNNSLFEGQIQRVKKPQLTAAAAAALVNLKNPFNSTSKSKIMTG